MTTVAVLALDGVMGFDLMVPSQVFGSAAGIDGWPLYETRIFGPAKWVTTEAQFGSCRLEVPWGMEALSGADIVVVPGHSPASIPAPAAVLDGLVGAAEAGSQIVSICTGAFILAASGLLDGSRATTHWRCADELAARFPAVEVEPNVLFVDNGQVLTCAGMASGVDLCLHLIQRQYGAAVAAETARRNLRPPHRPGSQTQYAESVPYRLSGHTLQEITRWLEANLHRRLSIEEIARYAETSVRTLSRRFQRELGTSPQQWLLSARVRRAQQLLETTELTVDQIATSCGFGPSENLRYHFGRLAKVTPTAYRAGFRNTATSVARAH
ncbi:GlxA family transcriptional regulator [Amycolatopsis nigrescens]|uniref:GlxA family transcriptional regulator n=1 Tax=Amycolatopsis nigrescens TaxID=381445 RepID=UPI00036A70A1|nr:helix-turn-helix domain-containing protein [Amycolatopsis nigrescens]